MKAGRIEEAETQKIEVDAANVVAASAEDRLHEVRTNFRDRVTCSS